MMSTFVRPYCAAITLSITVMLRNNRSVWNVRATPRLVIECGGNAGLVLETRAQLGCQEDLGTGDLQRHVATKLRIVGQKDNAETSLSQLAPEDALLSDGVVVLDDETSSLELWLSLSARVALSVCACARPKAASQGRQFFQRVA